MFKLTIAICFMLLMAGCTVNGKKLGDMMEKKESATLDPVLTEVSDNPEDAPSLVAQDKNSSFKINFKWADKEKHDGKEAIGTIGGE